MPTDYLDSNIYRGLGIEFDKTIDYQNLVQIPLFLAKAIARRLLRSFFISKESL